MPLSLSIPAALWNLPTETNLDVVWPMFEMTHPVSGDAAEFGCFRGTFAIKMAYEIAARRLDKRVYAFDTFEGFQVDDSDGATKVGAYGDNLDAFNELMCWRHVLPLNPIRGDARLTCAAVSRPLSFVWLDMDIALLMAPVLDHLEKHRLLAKDTIIGFDDVGRPETPTVKPWLEGLVRDGRLKLFGEGPDGTFISFCRIRDG